MHACRLGVPLAHPTALRQDRRQGRRTDVDVIEQRRDADIKGVLAGVVAGASSAGDVVNVGKPVDGNRLFAAAERALTTALADAEASFEEDVMFVLADDLRRAKKNVIQRGFDNISQG